MGGVVLQAFALGFPERVKRLALLNSPVIRPFNELITADQEQQELSKYTLQYQAYAPGDPIDLDYVVRNIRDLSWRQYVKSYLQASPLIGMLSYYKVNYLAPPYLPLDESDRDTFVSKFPALIVFGKEDPYFSIRHLSDIWRWFTGSVRLTLVPGAGHWVHQDAPELVNAELRSWLELDLSSPLSNH
ncbi:alpha/beta hydrolase [Paraburkholderia dipogonis]|uniref:Alpha/beta hydrolase n=1 Tax=Paraburkholderia dipogonis TaxID=1211383 RepID=A0A4Y8MX38_9BURK|nr:alpha/beta hydrolase [Paraburkholderia dipogonis]